MDSFANGCIGILFQTAFRYKGGISYYDKYIGVRTDADIYDFCFLVCTSLRFLDKPQFATYHSDVCFMLWHCIPDNTHYKGCAFHQSDNQGV